jgi:hypothetical protein
MQQRGYKSISGQRVRLSHIPSRASPPAITAGLQRAYVAGRSLGPDTAFVPLSSVVCVALRTSASCSSRLAQLGGSRHRFRSPHHNGHRVPSGAAGAGEAHGTRCTAHRSTDVPLEPATRARHSITLLLHTYTLLAFCGVVHGHGCVFGLVEWRAQCRALATTTTLCAQPHTAFRMVASGHRSDQGFHAMPIPLMCPQWYSPRRCEKAWHA